MILLNGVCISQPDRFYLNHLTQSDGLSQTTNHIIYKDSYGFVWISSLNGLNRYDGQQIKVYKYHPEDSTSIPDNYIQSKFIEDEDANLWFSTYEALVCYVRKHDHFISFQLTNTKGIPKNKGYRLAFLNKLKKQLGIIVEGNSLHLFDLKMNKWLEAPTQIFPSFMHQAVPIYDEYDSLISLITFHQEKPGLYIFDLNSSEDENYIIMFDGKRKNEPALHFEDVLKFSDTLFWATEEGFLTLVLKGNPNWKLIPTQDWYPSKLSLYKKNKILASLNGGGLCIMDRENINLGKQYVHDPKDPLSLASNITFGILGDDDGMIWAGVTGVGIDFTQPNKIKFKALDIGKLFGIFDRTIDVYSLAEDKSGNLWCSSRTSGIFVLSHKLEPLFHFNMVKSKGKSLPDDDVPYLFIDSNERCWAFTYNGLGVIKIGENNFELVAPKDKIFLYGIELQDQRFLFSLLNGGIVQLEETSNGFNFKDLLQFDTLSAFTHLYQNREGLLFLNKDISSILVVDPSNDFRIINEIPIRGDVFCYYEETNSNIIWIATINGLVRLDQSNWQWETFTEEDGLPDQQINSISGDESGSLWLATNRGLVRFFPDEERFRVFSLYDGLQGLEYSMFSFLKRSNGEFWFGGSEGINIFKPNEVTSLNVKPNPTITYFEINNEAFPDYLADIETNATNVTQLKKIELSYNQNDLSIGIAALEYSDPFANEYYFQIVGNEDTITRRGKKSTFEYPNMQPGTYTLNYNASNSDGVWFDDLEKQLDIVINPPWWETWWARTLFALAGLGLIYAFYRYRIAQIRKEEAFKRKEAEYKQLVAETETAVLRLQMNPHFIFNSMNSINSYILQKDVDTASDYLHRFAKLMRMILKFAAKPLIAISDEIELLELYLQTEAMRFDKKFNYSFDLKDDLDPDEFVIPTMILQPFVENAIWHGLSNKKDGEGMIKVSFWQENESFFCSVEDNGIGRAASSKISRKGKTHESKAISITEHRLQLLGNKNGATASFEIQDLKGLDQNPAGTKVVLRFPLL
jgi:ligand-binding sensor domain-containing protein/two-component sensor histidine kinase